MKAAIYNGVKKIDFVELPMPQCDDNGIVVKNICASICGSDVTAYNYGGATFLGFEDFSDKDLNDILFFVSGNFEKPNDSPLTSE